MRLNCEMSTTLLQQTKCAICNTPGNSTQIYSENFQLGDFNPEVFSARRLPDRIHYRIVRCNECGLVRSDPVADQDTLAMLYNQSTFDYGNEVKGLRATYGRYIDRLNRFGCSKAALLEIGCGNGFFLEEAISRGFRSVWGVEPGAQVVAQAPEILRKRILCDMMRPGLFPRDTFDVVCLFQVFDHIPDPRALLQECLNVMRPGALVLILNHNVDSLSSRILGERSPIIDIEHTFLYSLRTLDLLARKCGMEVLDKGPVVNNYSLGYFIRLLPLSSRIKHIALRMLHAARAERFSLSIPIGNLFLIARKPLDGN